MGKAGGKTLLRTVDLAYIGLMVAVMSICAWITIPGSVPFTMQTLGVFLTLGLLGGKRGTEAVVVYLVLGLMGVPVFSGFRGGLSVLFGTSGGYLAGFLFAAFLQWFLMDRLGRGYRVLALSMTAGQMLCYLTGTLWYWWAYASGTGNTGLRAVILTSVLPFVLPDFLKILLALFLTRRLRRFIM